MRPWKVKKTSNAFKSMKTIEIAQSLLNRRNAMNPVVMQGEMINTLGHDGLQEALQRRWLVPDMSSGYLLVSQDMSKVLEMREAAEESKDCAKCKKSTKDCVCPKDDDKEDTSEKWTKPWERPQESHNFVTRHAERNISELLSPGTGHDSGGGLTSGSSPTSAAPRQPVTPPPAAPTSAPQAVKPPGTNTPGVGDSVAVAPKGGATESQAYTGVVTSSANGMVKIKFGDTEREYPENEVQVMQKMGQAPA